MGSRGCLSSPADLPLLSISSLVSTIGLMCGDVARSDLLLKMLALRSAKVTMISLCQSGHSYMLAGGMPFSNIRYISLSVSDHSMLNSSAVPVKAAWLSLSA